MELNVKHALQDKKISQRAFAAFLGLSEKAVQNKLHGKSPFTFPEAQKIKQELLPEYDSEYLFSPSKPSPN